MLKDDISMVSGDCGMLYRRVEVKEAWERIKKHYKESCQLPTTGDKTAEALPVGEITPDCDKCIYVKTGYEICSSCHNFNKYTPGEIC